MPPYKLTDRYAIITGSPDELVTLTGDVMASFEVRCRLIRHEIVNPREIELICKCADSAYFVFEEDLRCDLSYEYPYLTLFFR